MSANPKPADIEIARARLLDGNRDGRIKADGSEIFFQLFVPNEKPKPGSMIASAAVGIIRDVIPNWEGRRMDNKEDCLGFIISGNDLAAVRAALTANRGRSPQV